jgi:aminoglycoside 3-N-acetyltransferase
MTRDELVRLFDTLNVRGNNLVVHASLSCFGDVDGGARTVCTALIDAVGESGTIVLPAFTCTETLNSPAANSAGGPPPRRAVAFHPELPVSRAVGAIAEAFRHLPGVLRSSHPTHSFAAWGRQAREVLSTQRDNNALGPLKKLNVMQGHVLLLGTTLEAATVIHLAEEGVGVPYLGRSTAVRVNAAGYDERVVLENLPGCSTAFVMLEPRLDPTKVRSVALAKGAARKIPIRYLVGEATKALESDAYAFVCENPACRSCAAKRDAFADTRLSPGSE